MNQAVKYINILEGFKSYIKSCHWSARNMNEHKLCDDISKTISDNEDEIAEIAQGIDGKFSITDIKPKRMKFESTKDLLEKLLKETKSYYSTIKGRKYTGLRSIVEGFIGEINKYNYLLKLVLKEDLKRRIKSNLNESRIILEYDEDKFPDWTRKELKVNDSELENMVDSFKERIANVNGDEDVAFDIVRDLGHINATTLKKSPSLPRNQKPRDLPDEEFAYQKKIYAIKDEILPLLIDLYLENGWDLSIDMAKASEKYGAAVFFRNLSTGIQNSFHGYKGDYSKIKKNDSWDGVMNAYRYGKNAEKYTPSEYSKAKTKFHVNQDLKAQDKENEVNKWHMGESYKPKTIFITEKQMKKIRLINEMFEPSMLWLGNYIEQNYKMESGEPIDNAEDIARELLDKYHPKSKRDVDEILHYPQHYPLSFEVIPL